MIKNLDLALCTILKLKAVLKEMEANEDNSTKDQPKAENMKEMAKKEPLELCKANLSAQATNYAWDKFKNLINNTAKFLNLEGKDSTL